MRSSSGGGRPSVDTDRLLVEAKSGSTSAIDTLLALLSQRLQVTGRWRWRRRGSRSPCDVVQDALLIVRQKIDRFPGATFTELESWAWGIFHNLRRNANKQHRPQAINPRAVKLWLALVGESAPSELELAEDELERGRAVARVYEVYEIALEQHERQVIELRVYAGHSWDEIGRMTRIKADTARQKYKRAIARLQELLSDDKA